MCASLFYSESNILFRHPVLFLLAFFLLRLKLITNSELCIQDDGEEEAVVVVPSVKEPLLSEEVIVETTPEPTPQPTPEPKQAKKEKKKDPTMVDREAAVNDQFLHPTSPNLTDTIDLPP